jgi:hypothetical protein
VKTQSCAYTCTSQRPITSICALAQQKNLTEKLFAVLENNQVIEGPIGGSVWGATSCIHISTASLGDVRLIPTPPDLFLFQCLLHRMTWSACSRCFFRAWMGSAKNRMFEWASWPHRGSDIERTSSEPGSFTEPPMGYETTMFLPCTWRRPRTCAVVFVCDVDVERTQSIAARQGAHNSTR